MRGKNATTVLSQSSATVQRNGRTAAADRRAHVIRWQASGRTQKAYCAEHNLKYGTFCQWAHKEQRREDEGAPSGFVPLAAGGGGARMEISLGEVVVRVY